MNLQCWVHKLWTKLVYFCWLNFAHAWQQDHSKEKFHCQHLMPVSFGKSSLIFSHSTLMFFSINLVMEVKYWVMFFHVCLQSLLGTGQGCGTLAHNMESLSKESNNNCSGFIAPKHTDYYYCISASSLTTYQINCLTYTTSGTLFKNWSHLWPIY